jgi:hypothetical protein
VTHYFSGILRLENGRKRGIVMVSAGGAKGSFKFQVAGFKLKDELARHAFAAHLEPETRP